MLHPSLDARSRGIELSQIVDFTFEPGLPSRLLRPALSALGRVAYSTTGNSPSVGSPPVT